MRTVRVLDVQATGTGPAGRERYRCIDSIKAAASPASGALHYIGLQEVARRIASRELSPVQLTRHMLDRIAQIDPVLKSHASVMSEQALDDARAAEKEIQAPWCSAS